MYEFITGLHDSLGGFGRGVFNILFSYVILRGIIVKRIVTKLDPYVDRVGDWLKLRLIAFFDRLLAFGNHSLIWAHHMERRVGSGHAATSARVCNDGECATL